jgi:hypothetical protein
MAREKLGWWQIEAGPVDGETDLRHFLGRESKIRHMVESLRRARRDWVVVCLFLGKDRAGRVPREVKRNASDFYLDK